MPEFKYIQIPDEPKVDTGKDWLYLSIGLLGAIKLILAAPPFEITLPQETLDAWANLIAVGFTAYGICQNTYISKEAQKQKDVLQQAGLKDE